MRHHQMVLCVHRSLDVVSHQASTNPAGNHRPCIRIGEGYLSIRLLFQPHFNIAHVLHALAQRGDLLFESLCFCFCHWVCFSALGSVCSFQGRHVALDAFIDLLHALLQLVLGVILVPVVDGLELAAVDGNDNLGE